MASMSQLTMAMVTLYSGDPKRIQHFMKVYAFAKMIAEEEQLGAKQREIVEAAALVHDIGIHAAEKKYRSAAGEYQEIEGRWSFRRRSSTVSAIWWRTIILMIRLMTWICKF